MTLSTSPARCLAARLRPAAWAVIVTLALAVASGCDGDDPGSSDVAVATRSPSPAPTVEPTPLASPTVTPGLDIAFLPRIDGRVESASTADDGSIAVAWRVDAAPATVVRALADAIRAGVLTLLLDERGAGGGIVAFEGESASGERIAGHYLVTSGDGGETRVDLRLDPPLPPAAAPPGAVPLPAGYPAERVPVYPGSTVTYAAAEARADGATRFVLVFESARDPIEVLGFYRDLLSVEGWSVSATATTLGASTTGGWLTIAAAGAPPVRVRLELDWTVP